MDQFKCTGCKQLTSILVQKLYPRDYQGYLYCKSCIENYQSADISSEQMKIYQNELLTSTCDCPNDGKKSPGKFFDQTSLVVYCVNCKLNNQNLLWLDYNLPRPNLISIADMILQRPDLPVEIKKKLLKSHDMSVDDILFQLRKYLCYVDSYAYCMKHLRLSDEYLFSKNKFEFKCKLCTPEENLCDLKDMNQFAFILEEAKNYCKEAKTAAFNSVILKYLKNRNIDHRTVYNFLYEMKDLIDSKNSNLTESSICLFCELPFNVLRLPYPVHDTEKHEICSECLKKTDQNTCCPIDGEPIIRTNKFIYPKFIYDLDLLCHLHDSNQWFAVCNNIIPYQAKCSHNICSECYKSGKIDRCRKCNSNIESKSCIENLELKRILEFLEIMCPTHNKPVNKWKIEGDEIKTLCRSCPGSQFYRSTYLDVSVKIKEILTKRSEGCQKLLKLLNKFESLPLSYRFSLLNMKENSTKIFNLPDQIIPSSDTGLNFWYDKGSTFQVLIESNVHFLICGIILGKCVKGDINEISIFNREKQIPFNVYYHENYLILNFYTPIECNTNPLFFNIKLASGKYYQRKKNSQRIEKNKYEFTPNDYFEVSFLEAKCGDMKYGGPFIGLLGEDFYWLDSYIS